MTISQKLNIIKSELGLSQEKLATKLEVSFATLNSWINKRSKPHPRKQVLIDELYKKVTGQTLIPETELLAKKELIQLKSKKYKNIISTIKNRQDIYDQFVLSLTYNSNSIEGSTLTEDDTAAIIFDNASLSNKSLIEHLEAKNHQSALEFLFSQIKKDYKISEEFILKLHSVLMNSIKPDAGNYRSHGVRIVGANVPTANYLKVLELMNSLIKEINKPNKDTINHVSKIHSRFEQIHPFSDGNGRIGRLLIHAMLLRKNLPPAIIKQEDRRQYYSSLNKSQKESEFSLLENFICDSVLQGFEILN
jgi:Fic family protein